MPDRTERSALTEVRRDESGNRRMWANERDLYLRRLRDWRRAVRRMAKHSVEIVREKMPLRLVALTVLTISVSIFYVHWRMPPKPDPSYVEARWIVQQYELGKSHADIDYRHPIYSRAFQLLAEVKTDSISIDEARQFRTKLSRSARVFEKRRAETLAKLEAAREAETDREDTLERSQRFTSGVDKAAVSAHECEEELAQFEARMDVLGGLKE